MNGLKLGFSSGSAPVLAPAEKHKTNINTGLFTSTNYTLFLFGLKSIESITHNLASVVLNTLSHVYNGFNFEARPLVRGSHGGSGPQMFSASRILRIGENKDHRWSMFKQSYGVGTFAVNNPATLQIKLLATTAAYLMQ